MNAAIAPSSSLFQTWPLLATSLCASGLFVRALVTRTELRGAGLALHRARLWVSGGRVPSVALVLLLAGHLAALLFPGAILAWNRAPARLYLLEGLGLAVGLGALAAWGRATSGHLRRAHVPFIVEIGDSLFLAMIFLALASGLGMAALHRWGSSWGVVTLRPYALSILAGEPQSMLVERLPFLARLHLFATFAALAVFPLTRLAPLPILLVSRAAAGCARPVAWLWRTGGAALRDRCAAWLWNEPEVRWIDQPAAAAEAALEAARASWRNRLFRPDLARAITGERAGFPSAGKGPVRKART
jgi:nitrate reductase gamma subunit